MTEQLIRIASVDGSYLTPAVVHGYFAIVYFPENNEWSLTHVPTGYAIGGSFRSEHSVLVALKNVEALELDWSFSDPGHIAAWPKATRARVKAACKVVEEP